MGRHLDQLVASGKQWHHKEEWRHQTTNLKKFSREDTVEEQSKLTREKTD
jgi:hypothetical protein